MNEEIKSTLFSHGEKLDSLTGQMELIAKKVVEHDEQLDFISKKVVEHDERFDYIFKKLIEHDDRLERIEENMATKNDIQNITTTLDQLVVLAQKKDQELTLLAYGMRRIEDKTDKNTEDIKELKILLI